MVIRSIGNSLIVILPDIVGKKLTNWFDLVRPLTEFKFETVSSSKCPTSAMRLNWRSCLQILNRTNNIFELLSVEPVLTDKDDAGRADELINDDSSETGEEKNLRLKGTNIQ